MWRARMADDRQQAGMRRLDGLFTAEPDRLTRLAVDVEMHASDDPVVGDPTREREKTLMLFLGPLPACRRLRLRHARHDELLAALRGCAELRDNLAGFYKQSDQNGMPWGIWDPQYQPVGVCKIKQ